ncbi:MAG TPA: PilT/PilU family type 4a pilus ATPase, partial [Burkholderiales bacterium]
MDDLQANKYMHDLLGLMVSKKGSDLFIAPDFAPSIKIDGKITPVANQKLAADHTKLFAYALMNDKQRREFETERECNFAISPEGIGRFRVNVFWQQEHVSMVCRTIATKIPTIEDLGLPQDLKEIVMARRGLILMVGGTGSGKSTSLAGMINHRNANSSDHIVTIEDPVEYVHPNQSSLISQREIGRDTLSWENALKNTLRQAPDVIFIGEIREKEVMEHALAFAETGHLCMATLHANNANQAIDRVLNFFSTEKRAQVLMDLSLNLRAIISQRLIRKADGRGRAAAVEIMQNTPLIADMIYKGEINEIKEGMIKAKENGCRTFDMALFDLAEAGVITREEAVRNADSVNDIRVRFKLESKSAGGMDEFKGAAGLTLDEDVTRKLGLNKKI